MGILTVGVVTKPFEFEARTPHEAGRSGLVELEANVDSLIVVLNEKLLDVLGEDVTQDEAFAQSQRRAAQRGRRHQRHHPHPRPCQRRLRRRQDRDERAWQGHDGHGHGVGPDRATKAAEAAVTCPLLEGIDLSGAAACWS